MSFGTLYIIPVPLSKQVPAKSFTPYLVDTINQIKEYIVENEKTARYFLKEAGLKILQSELVLHDYGKHNRGADQTNFFKGLLAGNDVGLMSEAGCPGVADPGADLIHIAHQKGIKVVPLVGPSSILLALMASGFNGQSFAFHGYLPIDKADRTKRLKELEVLAIKHKQTQLFMETPFRNNALLEVLLKTCQAQMQLSIACNLTAEDEFIQTKTIQQWSQLPPDLHKKPTIFTLYAPL